MEDQKLVGPCNASGHQVHEPGGIGVMRLDQMFGQSHHVACASSRMSMREARLGSNGMRHLIRNTDTGTEIATMRRGMPPPPRAGAPPVSPK